MSLENYRLLLDALQEAAFVLNSRREIVIYNNAAEELFGKGYTGEDFVRVVRHPQCLEIIARAMASKERCSVTIDVEYPVRATFRVVAADIENSDLNEARVLVSFRDISDVRSAEQMRTDFVANVSHELRSPLTALSGFIETLKGAAKEDEKARNRFLGLMEHEAQRMVRLIADLLSLSKVEANLRIRPTGSANIQALIERVTTTLGKQAENESKMINVEVAKEIGMIPGNEDELTQVFQNLLENAIKYGAANSTIWIKANFAENVSGIPGQAVAISVSDQGEGISNEHISRLTERFYRVDTHRSRDKGGTGLGLAIVKHIINRHRGRLNITSQTGAGSVFTVYLPGSV